MHIGFGRNKEKFPTISPATERPMRILDSATGPTEFIPSKFLREIVNGVVSDYRVSPSGERHLIAYSTTIKN